MQVSRRQSFYFLNQIDKLLTHFLLERQFELLMLLYNARIDGCHLHPRTLILQFGYVPR